MSQALKAALVWNFQGLDKVLNYYMVLTQKFNFFIIVQYFFGLKFQEIQAIIFVGCFNELLVYFRFSKNRPLADSFIESRCQFIYDSVPFRIVYF